MHAFTTMDPINVEKLQAMKSYNKSKDILSTMAHYSLVAQITLGFFLSTPLWLPTLCSSLSLFFLDSLPKVVATVCGPKCLFVVFHLIIIFLVGESRLAASSSSSSKPNIYEEYLSHAQRLKGLSTGEELGKETVAEGPSVEEEEEEEEEEMREEKIEEIVESEGESTVEKEEGGMKSDNEVLVEEEEERGLLPAEELNQRVEAFIAMVNTQMRLEARMLTCCG